MQTAEISALLELTQIHGLGPARIRTLVTRLGSSEAVLEASVAEMSRLEGIDLKLAQTISRYKPAGFADVQLEKSEAEGCTIISFRDEAYPDYLKRIYDPPVLLFVRGSFAEADRDAVAIVGTRMPSAYGRQIAQELARGMASSGLTVVSGFAKGIDTVAHRGALAVGGRTIAVLGNGLDIVYPAANRKIVDQVENNGAVISEFPFGTKPDAGNFPRRNRIISGLSHAIVVVEAGHRSGAILTALNAVDQNRDVFAVPGRVTDSKSVGCNRLIRNGAIPVRDSQHILEILTPRLHTPARPVQRELKLEMTEPEMAVYSVLSGDPKYVDDIVAQTELDPSTVLTILLGLELKGVVTQLSGKQFTRT